MFTIHNDPRRQSTLHSDCYSPQSSPVNAHRISTAPTKSNEKIILHYAEAKKKFRSDPPPFVKSKRRSEIISKWVIIAGPNGEYPADPSTATYRMVVPRRWYSDEFFWTLDLGNERWIVQNWSGAPKGGCHYRRWLGVDEEFESTAIAFSANPYQNNHQIGVQIPHGRNRPSLNNTSSRASTKERVLQQNDRRHRELASRDNNSHQSTPTYPKRYGYRKPFVEDEVSEVSSDDIPIRPTRSRKRSRTELEREQTTKLCDATTQDSDKTYTPPTSWAHPSTQCSSGSSQPQPHTSPTSVLSEFPHSTVSLSPDKINQTTLLLCLSSAPDDFFPLSLRSCMTVATFFTSVLDALNVDEGTLNKVRISFPWISGKTLVMKRSPTDSFEWFLKAVNKAPCWERGEECDLKVELFLK